jgi:glycosyltransferase involved in cell wall biosynthesis
MHKTAQITLIVPCYNQARFLDEALRTVFNQSYEFWECIIVNDGSTDHTAAIAKYWVEKDGRFSYVYKKNAGLSSARNTGVKLSKTSYILPFDSDDKLHLDFLQKAMDVLSKNQNIEVLSTRVQHFGVKNNVLELPKYSYEKLLIRNCFIACSIFKKSTFDRVGGYDENLKSFEDWEFWIRALKDGGHHYEINEVLYYYRKHKSESLSNRFRKDKEFYESIYDYVYKKHRSLYDQYFPNFILLYADYVELEAFSDKVKRNFMFKIYHSVKFLFKK